VFIDRSGLIPADNGAMFRASQMIEARRNFSPAQALRLQPASRAVALQLAFGPHERSLSRERFQGQNAGKPQQNNRKRHPNPTVAGRCYAASSPPKIC
jgi:hypothetical protein